ncbi:MAG: hypothetical protein K8S15_08075 [Candidatus Aegiribacteria sp.]|nr:hypothetical protein [Candidatus Aegiribacteria sp.]
MFLSNCNGTMILVTILAVFTVSAFGEEPAFSHEIQLPSLEEMGPIDRVTDSEVRLTPPPNPQVGDSWIWYLFTWESMPPHFIQDTCVVRGKSDRGYVMVRDCEWNVTINQADVDSILEHWENSSIGPYPNRGIYEIDSLSFGVPPDELDNDPRIYLMWYNFHVAADGFFFYFDEYPDGTFPGYPSNECEVLYLNTASSGGPSGDYMLAVAAHEFEHLIHWKYDDDESTWVDEGMAELAMWFYGHPDVITSFNNHPDNNLTVWDGNWADYIQTYLWSLYFFERYGGHPAVFALVHEPANSMAGYDNVLDDFGYSENTDDIFIDWSVANFLDDTSLVDGRYGYIGDDLPPFYAKTYSSYPVAANGTVNNWATDYYRFEVISIENLTLTFDGSDSNKFGVRVLFLRPDSIVVLPMTLDEPTQSGSLEINNLTNPLDQIVLVIASVSSSGGPDYQFTAYDPLGISIDPSQLTTNIDLILTPNPFSSVVDIQLNWNGTIAAANPTIDIYDLQGRIVQRLTADVLSDGEASVQWNGDIQAGTHANAGIYYARARVGSAQCVAKLLLLP